MFVKEDTNEFLYFSLKLIDIRNDKKQVVYDITECLKYVNRF